MELTRAALPHTLMITSALASTLLLALAPTTPQEPPTSELAAQFETHLDELAARDEFSGAVLIAQGDEILLRKAYGFASRRYGAENRPDTKFAMGSMNKMFTGVAICQLVERGLLSFESTIGEVLPDYPNERAAIEVTVAHLLTHTSGIPSYWNDEYERRWKSLRSVPDLLALFVDEPLRFAPGSRYEYSNGAPIVLGRMIEVLTGEDYFDYIREHVTAPLGMTNTDSYEAEDSVPNLAMGYTHLTHDGQQSDEWLENTLVHTVRGGPAGGGYTTVDDMLRFAQGLRSHKLMSPEMTLAYLQGGDVPNIKYPDGYLIARMEHRGIVEQGHSGGAPGVSTNFGFFPELDLTFVILTNQDEGALEVSSFLRQLVHGGALLGAPADQDSYWFGASFAIDQHGPTTIQSVVEGGPAAAAGFLAGDMVLNLNGTICSGDEFLTLLGELLLEPDPIACGILRGADELTLEVTPGKRP